MNKSISMVLSLLSVAMVGLLAFTTIQTANTIKEIKAEQKASAEAFKYVVTEINGDEINGLAITHKTSDNGGVVLSKRIDCIDPQIGDIVEVTYGEAFDDIQKVKIVE